VGKMNQILCCDWLPEQARWRYLACLGIPAMFHKTFPRSYITNLFLTKLFQSRIIKNAGYWPCSVFLVASVWTFILSWSINMQKKSYAYIQPSWPHDWSITHMYMASVVCSEVPVICHSCVAQIELTFGTAGEWRSMLSTDWNTFAGD